jgi:hypothetical protein
VELLMPAKSKKQQKFMAAVANNPKFAKKVGVSQNIGEEFMKAKKYNMGGMMANVPESGPRKKKKPAPRAPYDDSGVNVGGGPKGGPKPSPKGTGGVMAGPNPMTGGPMPPKKKKRAPMGMGQDRGGAMPMMKKGGKVRGCGMAKQGVRKAKMVTMKGA